MSFSKCQFISAEINHDFNKSNPRLNEYQQEVWNINTICPNNLIVGPPPPNPPLRNTGESGDENLITQVFQFPDNPQIPVTKGNLKSRLRHTEFPINCLVTPVDNLSQSIQNQYLNAATIPQIGTCSMYIAEAKTNNPDPTDLFKVFKYPDENFLIIDAVPNFVTTYLKQLRFPVVPPRNANEELNAHKNYTNQTISNLPPLNNTNGWPFRPKINIINTPHTQGDPSTAVKPGSTKFSIDKLLPPGTLNSDLAIIPGLPENTATNGVPLIFSWYCNGREESQNNNALMMSRYSIITKPQVIENANPNSYKMSQFWQGGTDGVGGINIFDAGKENSIAALKKKMLDDQIIPPNRPIGDKNVNQSLAAQASLLVQRKRSGDYLQIKTAYEFPAKAVASYNNPLLYRLVQGPFNALYQQHANGNLNINTNTSLGGLGNLKGLQIPQDQNWKNEQWYRNRTYFVTGDWPAFCYATYNRINSIIICQRAANGCSGSSDHALIFRNFFE